MKHPNRNAPGASAAEQGDLAAADLQADGTCEQHPVFFPFGLMLKWQKMLARSRPCL